jgi:hypothetical protein
MAYQEGVQGPGDLTPSVIDKDGKSLGQDKSSLSTRDLEMIDNIEAPVFDRDSYQRRNMDDLIYFNNRTGRPMKIIGTTHRVDKRGEDSKDPDNYDLSIQQDIQNHAVVSIPVMNRIFLEWTIHKSGNSYWEGLQTITIVDPNGKAAIFRTREGAVSLHVTPQESISPNSLFIENRTTGTDVRVKIYTQDPASYPPTKVQIPVFDQEIGTREHYEYTHIIRYRFWLVDWMKPVSASSLLDSSGSSSNSVNREIGSRDFRSGTIAWFSCARDVVAGNYIFIVSNTNQGGAKYVFVSKDKIYQIADQKDAALATHAGHTVLLTGEMKGDTITVSKIEMPKEEKK